jgi:hypothetical protein
MDGACAALGDAAAKLGACHAENVSKSPKQRHVIGTVDRLLFSIDP